MKTKNKIIGLMGLLIIGFNVETYANDHEKTNKNLSCGQEVVMVGNTAANFEREKLKDCTITIKNDDGTTLEVTFHDISWFQCAKIKVGKWFRDTF